MSTRRNPLNLRKSLARKAWQHYYSDPCDAFTDAEKAAMQDDIAEHLPGLDADRLTDRQLAERWLQETGHIVGQGDPLGDDIEAKYGSLS